MSRAAKGALLAAVSLLALDPAIAQEEPGAMVDTIVVTAQKRAQNLQDVPGTVNALTAETIERARVADVEDVAFLTPGLEFGSGAGRQVGFLSIRGVNSGTLGTSGVVTYLDGFTLGNNFTVPNVRLFDLERIEVLKGPQATLYGRNALGGVISYVTREPGDELEGKVSASYGGFDAVDVSAVVGGPLVEGVLRGQAGVAFRDREGYFDNAATGEANFNGEQDTDMRLALTFEPTDRFAADMIVNHSMSRDDAGASAYIPTDFSPFSPTDLRDGLVDLEAYDETLEYTDPGFFDRDITTAVLSADYEFDAATLTSITGYGRIAIDTAIDVDRGLDRFTPIVPSLIAVEDEERDVFSQELRLASPDEARFQWLVGAYAFYEEADRVATLNGGPLETATNEVENYALFLNASYDITDKLTFGGGLRYDYTETTNTDKLFDVVRSSDEDEVLPKIFATYEPTDELTLFASAAKGFKSGGFNPIGSGESVFDSEFVWHYEAGAKGRLFNNRMRYSIAYYHIDWTDQQLTQFDVITTFFTNAGESTIDGVEAEFAAALTEELDVFGAFAWTSAEFDVFELNPTNGLLGFGIGPDLSGNDVPYTPDITLAAGLEYVRPLANGVDGRLRLDGRYTGERELHFTGLLPQDAYWLANAYIGLETGKAELGVFADNVFDEEYHALGEL
ncbi:MAG: TonB-dependent receptor, partial [Caulobacterales bacterium]|nr:TonB-dependent receptor [Caulobacterales bacterium]